MELPDSKVNWYPLARIAEALDKRQWYWCTTAFNLKYINVRIDTRDNCAVVTFEDREGKKFAGNIDEFEAEMIRLDSIQRPNGWTFQDFKGEK